LNNIMGRKNQFDIWDSEYLLQGKDVVLIPNYHCDHLDTKDSPNGVFQLEHINNFRSSGFLKIDIEEDEISTPINSPFLIHVEIREHHYKTSEINTNSDFQTFFSYQIFEGKKLINEMKYLEKLDINKSKYIIHFLS